MQKLRIILTANFSPWSAYSGGGQRSTHNIATALAKLGHEVHVIYTKASFSEVNVPTNLFYEHHWATFFGFKDKRNAIFRSFSGYSVKSVLQRMLKLDSDIPQIVHANGEEGLKLIELKKIFDFKLVSSVRYSSLPIQMKPARRSLKDWLYLQLNHKKLLQQELTARQADVVCTPSNESAIMLKKHFRPLDKVVPIHNGIPEDFLPFQRNESIDVENAPIIYFGRLSSDKGLDTLLQAYSIFSKKWSNPLLIIGEGPEKSNLFQQIRHLRMETKVQLLGWKSHEDIGQFLINALMCVFPSIHEAFGLSIVTAMACGVPTISTNVGGIPEIISNKDVGILFEVNDVKDCAENMEKLRTSTLLNQQIGTNGKEHVRAHFLWEETAQKLINQVYL